LCNWQAREGIASFRATIARWTSIRLAFGRNISKAVTGELL
jgi:hypothetical protein